MTNPALKDMKAKPIPVVHIDLELTTQRWKKSIPDLEDRIDHIIRTILPAVQLPEKIAHYDEMIVTIVLTDNKTVHELNRDYRGQDKPTNVLGFAYIDSDEPQPNSGNYMLGDIFMAYETMKKEAAEQKKKLVNHFTHLLTHGFLHLLGYDHMNEEDAEEMETLEIDILGKLDIANPY